MIHGIAYTNLAALTCIALLLAPELARRIQHALAHRSTTIADQNTFKRKLGHSVCASTAAIVAIMLAAYDSVFVVAYLANQ